MPSVPEPQVILGNPLVMQASAAKEGSLGLHQAAFLSRGDGLSVTCLFTVCLYLSVTTVCLSVLGRDSKAC